jgi:hypothetical protein
MGMLMRRSGIGRDRTLTRERLATRGARSGGENRRKTGRSVILIGRHLGRRLTRHLPARTLQHAMSGDEFRRPGHQHGRQNGRLDARVVIRINTHLFLLRVERKLTALERFEFMMRLKVRPPPHPAVDHVRKSFSVGDLKSAIERPWNGDAFGLRRV